MEQLIGNPCGGYNISPELELMLLFKANVLKESMVKFEPLKADKPTNTDRRTINIFNGISNFFVKSKNQINSSDYEKYNNIYFNYMKSLKSNYGIEDVSFARIQTLVNKLIVNDYSYKNRIMFVINYILNMSDVQFDKDTFNLLNETYSRYLNFANSTTINDINKSFKKHWVDIVGNKSFNKKLAIGAFGIALAISLIAGPFGIGAASGVSHATLASLGGSIVGGMAVANAIAIAGSTALGVLVYTTKNKIDKHILLKEFKQLSTNDMSYVLTLNVTILEYIKKLYTNNCSDYKETISFLIDTNNDMLNDYFINLDYQNNYKEKISLMLKSFDIINNKI